MYLILLYNLFELIGINALPLIITKDHSLCHLLILWILLL